MIDVFVENMEFCLFGLKLSLDTLQGCTINTRLGILLFHVGCQLMQRHTFASQISEMNIDPCV